MWDFGNRKKLPRYKVRESGSICERRGEEENLKGKELGWKEGIKEGQNEEGKRGMGEEGELFWHPEEVIS